MSDFTRLGLNSNLMYKLKWVYLASKKFKEIIGITLFIIIYTDKLNWRPSIKDVHSKSRKIDSP